MPLGATWTIFKAKWDMLAGTYRVESYRQRGVLRLCPPRLRDCVRAVGPDEIYVGPKGPEVKAARIIVALLHLADTLTSADTLRAVLGSLAPGRRDRHGWVTVRVREVNGAWTARVNEDLRPFDLLYTSQLLAARNALPDEAAPTAPVAAPAPAAPAAPAASVVAPGPPIPVIRASAPVVPLMWARRGASSTRVFQLPVLPLSTCSPWMPCATAMCPKTWSTTCLSLLRCDSSRVRLDSSFLAPRTSAGTVGVCSPPDCVTAWCCSGLSPRNRRELCQRGFSCRYQTLAPVFVVGQRASAARAPRSYRVARGFAEGKCGWPVERVSPAAVVPWWLRWPLSGAALGQRGRCE